MYTGYDDVEDDVDDDLVSSLSASEGCPTAEDWWFYTGFHHVEEDVDDDLVSSLSASNWAVTASKVWRGASRGFLRQRCRTVRGAGNDLDQEHYSIKQYISKSVS